MNLNDLAAAVNPKCTFVPSLVRQSLDDPKFYIFLHIPKCGGIDFELSYKTALNLYCKMNNKSSFISRADDEASFKKSLESFSEIETKNLDFSRFYGIFSSHLGIRRLSQESRVPLTNIITILRHPADRLISSFCYTCMRANTLPTMEELDLHISQPNQINTISSLLDKKGDSSGDALENKIRNTFFACTDIENSSTLLGEMLSRNNFPNLLKENINQTLPEFKLKKTDIPDRILSKIRELNARDINLYDRFKTAPLMPECLSTGQLNPQTLLVSDDQTQQKCQSRHLLMKTPPLIEFLEKNKPHLPDRLGTIIKGIIAHNKPA